MGMEALLSLASPSGVTRASPVAESQDEGGAAHQRPRKVSFVEEEEAAQRSSSTSVSGSPGKRTRGRSSAARKKAGRLSMGSTGSADDGAWDKKGRPSFSGEDAAVLGVGQLLSSQSNPSRTARGTKRARVQNKE